MAISRYVALTPIRHNGKLFAVGDALALTDAQAASLGGAIAPQAGALPAMPPDPPQPVFSQSIPGQGVAKSIGLGTRDAVLGDFRPAARKRLMVFGDSIAAQSDDFIHAIATSPISGGDIKAGSTVLNVVSGAAFTNGQTIAVPLYHGELFTTTITAINTNALTIADKTPGLIRNTSNVRVYTAGYRPDMDLGIGLANGAVALTGGSVDVVGVYGYGGAPAATMLADLDRFLRYFRPHYVVLHLFENDLTATVASGGATIDQLKAFARQAAWSCLEHGACPIVCSSLPYNLIPASRAVDFDALAAYLTGQFMVDVPAAVGADCSTKWLDTSNPTYPRSPVAGLTDGVHPNINFRFSAAEQTLVPVLRSVLPAAGSLLDFVLTPREISACAGTGGTAVNLQPGSVVPASHTIRAFGTAVVTTSKNADGSLKILGAWPGATNRTSDYISDTITFNVPPAWAGGKQMVKGYVRIRCNALTYISQLFPEAQANGAEINDLNPGVDFSMSMPADGRVIVLETPAFLIPASSTTINVSFIIRPQQLGSPANAAIDVDEMEIGLLPAVPGLI